MQARTETAMTEKEIILRTKPFARESRLLSWFYTLSTLFILVTAWITLLIVKHWYFLIPLSVVTGLLMVRMFVIYHDYQHHTILHRSKVAHLLMTLYGIITLNPASIWKRSHDYHHLHNSKLFGSNIGSYPIMTKKKYLESSKKEQNAYLFSRHPLVIFGGYIFIFMYGMCWRSFLNDPKKHFDSLAALIIHYALSITLFMIGGLEKLLLVQTIPFLVSSATGAYLFYAQHNFPSVQFKDNGEWSYYFAAMHSSSYMKMNRLMEWFTANIGLHHIHHLNARIPFYKLKEAMKVIPELQNARTTSLNPIEVYRCLQLKVWDSVNCKMIGLREMSDKSPVS